jgi:hypothetical protein
MKAHEQAIDLRAADDDRVQLAKQCLIVLTNSDGDAERER